jgi:hypothetical protein
MRGITQVVPENKRRVTLTTHVMRIRDQSPRQLSPGEIVDVDELSECGMRHKLQIDCNFQLPSAEGINVLEDQKGRWPLFHGTLVNRRLLRIFIEDNSFFLVTTPD